jgi:hypothetical protein
MNNIEIENILSHAPRPTVPAGLVKQIQAEIALPSTAPESKQRERQNPLRRWFPALAFGVVMLSCAILMAVQANWSANLKRENASLRAEVAELPQLREKHAAWEQAQAKHDDLIHLRRDNDELHQLQVEAAQSRNLPARIEQLQSENKRLAAAPMPSATTTNATSFFEDARAESERIRCVNNLKQIGLAMRIWSGENGDRYPASFLLASNEMNVTQILVCPSDTARQTFARLGFAKFQEEMTSYKFTMHPEDDAQYPQCIIARCPIHGNYLLADGSVQQINLKNPAYHEVNIDGRWYLKSINDTNFQERTVAPAQ